MANEHPAHHDGKPDIDPTHQTGEGKGKIKKEQLTDATMPTKDMPLGSVRDKHPH